MEGLAPPFAKLRRILVLQVLLSSFASVSAADVALTTFHEMQTEERYFAVAWQRASDASRLLDACRPERTGLIEFLYVELEEFRLMAASFAQPIADDQLSTFPILEGYCETNDEHIQWVETQSVEWRDRGGVFCHNSMRTTSRLCQ